MGSTTRGAGIQPEHREGEEKAGGVLEFPSLLIGGEEVALCPCYHIFPAVKDSTQTESPNNPSFPKLSLALLLMATRKGAKEPVAPGIAQFLLICFLSVLLCLSHSILLRQSNSINQWLSPRALKVIVSINGLTFVDLKQYQESVTQPSWP